MKLSVEERKQLNVLVAGLPATVSRAAVEALGCRAQPISLASMIAERRARLDNSSD